MREDDEQAQLPPADPATWRRIAVTYTAAKTGNLLPLAVYADLSGGRTLRLDDCTLTDA